MSWRSGPPGTGRVKSWRNPSTSATYASVFPSGDHAGHSSSPSPKLSCASLRENPEATEPPGAPAPLPPSGPVAPARARYSPIAGCRDQRRRGHERRARRRRTWTPVRHAERRGELRDARLAVARGLGQRPGEHRPDGLRNRPCHTARQGRLLGEMLGHDGMDGRAGERRHAGQHLVHHARQRVEIGARVEVAGAARLLGTHVRRRADDDAGAGELRRLRVGRPRDPEVRHQRAAVRREQDVLRLHVPVDHPVLVGVVQAARHVARDAERVFPRKRTHPAQPLPQRLALDVRHGEPEDRIAGRGGGDLARVVDRDHMRMLQPGGEHDLAEEPVAAERGRQLRAQHLERDRAVVAEVPREPDGGHATVPELALDGVAATQAVGQVLCSLVHWHRHERRGRAEEYAARPPSGQRWETAATRWASASAPDPCRYCASP